MTERYLTPAAFGRAVEVSPRTVQHWCARGRLPVEVSASGCYQIPAVYVPLYREGTLPLASPPRTRRRPSVSTY